METFDALFKLADLAFKFADIIFKLIDAVAIPLTLGVTWLTHQQRSMFEMVDKMYALCHVLHDHVARNPRVSHLFAIERDSISR
jgi:hypothetical protein